jgi:predicted amidohydrolase YtcJ
VQACIGANTQVIDLHGRMVVPGFQDSHVHPVPGGTRESQVQLDDQLTHEAIVRFLRIYVANHPKNAWILGRGWYETPFLPSGIATRQMLVALVPDRPAFLLNAS